MPVKIPDDLPATSALESENIFVMRETRARSQDIRELRILLLNLMPTKVETEIQILRLLSNSPLQTEVDLLQTASHESRNTSSEYLHKFYKTFDEVRDQKYDGLIVTGAPVERMDFEEVDYWPELCEIMDWSRTNVTSTLYLCWGAMAGLYHHYGIPKHPLEHKVSGIYRHQVISPTEPLLRGFDDWFYIPHSRHTKVRYEDIRKNPHLHIVSSSEESGVAIVISERNEVFITGHFEYDLHTLAYEYERDLAAGMDPRIPENYFEDDDPCKDPIMSWRSHATLFYNNWLNYHVYQETPYDIDEIGRR